MTANEVKPEIDGATRMFQAWEQEHGIRVSPSIHFTGGEPFLYDRFWDVVAYARGKGYGVAVMTNGCLVTEEDAQKALGLGISDIQVSLEGPPNLHISIRGKGSFNAASKGVEYLVAAGNRVSANVTLSRININKIEETTEIAKEMGFYSIGFSRIVPCGRGKALIDHLLTPQELKSAYQKIISLGGVGAGSPPASIRSICRRRSTSSGATSAGSAASRRCSAAGAGDARSRGTGAATISRQSCR